MPVHRCRSCAGAVSTVVLGPAAAGGHLLGVRFLAPITGLSLRWLYVPVPVGILVTGQGGAVSGPSPFCQAQARTAALPGTTTARPLPVRPAPHRTGGITGTVPLDAGSTAMTVAHGLATIYEPLRLQQQKLVHGAQLRLDHKLVLLAVSQQAGQQERCRPRSGPSFDLEIFEHVLT